MILINKTTGVIVAGQMEMARGFCRRLRGLLGRKSFPAGSALVIEPCRQVHTFFMPFPIDVIFLDRRGLVLATFENMSPSRVSPLVRDARSVVELPAGAIEAGGVAIGDTLQIINMEGTV